MKKLGLSRFDNDKIRQFSELGDSLYQQKTQELSTQFTQFKSILLRFIKQHNDELISNDELRSQFVGICKQIGIDPLTIYNRDSSKIKDFYHELSMRIIEFSNSTKFINGGLLSIDNVLNHFNNNLGLNITFKDIETSVNSLSVLNSDLKLIEISGKSYLKIFNLSISNDERLILEIVNQLGFINASILRDNCHWSRLKSVEMLDSMLSKGYLWLDVFHGKKTYWDPSWISKLGGT